MCSRGFCKVLVLEPQHWLGWQMGHEECCLETCFYFFIPPLPLKISCEEWREQIPGTIWTFWEWMMWAPSWDHGSLSFVSLVMLPSPCAFPIKVGAAVWPLDALLPLSLGWLHLPATFQLWLSTLGVYLSLCAHGTIAYTSVQFFSLPLCESNVLTEAVDMLIVFRQRFCSLRTLFLWLLCPWIYYKGL